MALAIADRVHGREHGLNSFHAGRHREHAQILKAKALHVIFGAMRREVDLQLSLERRLRNGTAFDRHGGPIGFEKEIRMTAEVQEAQCKHRIGCNGSRLIFSI